MELQELKGIVSNYSQDIRELRLLDLSQDADKDFKLDTWVLSTDLCFFTIVFKYKYYAICAIISQGNKMRLISEMYRSMV